MNCRRFPATGPKKLQTRYQEFEADLPALLSTLHILPGELTFVEWRALTQEWLVNHPI